MADFQPVPLDIPPGLYTETTDLDARGKYVDGNNVRFWKQRPERIGGWDKYMDSALDGVPRGIIANRALDATTYIGVGTHKKLYVIVGGTAYDISPDGLAVGNINASLGASSAFGMGTYGSGTYGGLGSFLSPSTQPRIWTLAAWGEDLLAVARDDGKLYVWDKSGGTGTAATLIEDAPTNNLGVLVSEVDRHCILFGADGDPLNVAWSDQEDYSTWEPSATNTAGSKRVEDGNVIIAVVTTGMGHLILTDTAAFLMTYIGPPFVFSITKVGSKCGCIGPMAAIAVDNGAQWMGQDTFFSFNGSVQRVDCPVHSRVFGNLRDTQIHKVAAGFNAKFSETFWFFPSAASQENDGCVVAGPDGWWLGDVARTCWLDKNVVTRLPIGAASSGYLYVHESGTEGDGEPISYSLKGVGIDVANGANFAHIRKIEPDWGRIEGSHLLTVGAYDYPHRAPRAQGPYEVTSATDKLSVRARGKLLSINLSGSDDFRIGLWRAWIKPHGEQP